MKTWQQTQNPSYQTIARQIDALMALPYQCREDYWWGEELSRLQAARDAIVPPKGDGHIVAYQRRHERRKHQHQQEWGTTRLSQIGRMRQQGMNDENIVRILEDWQSAGY